jgi:hypothetical protein
VTRLSLGEEHVCERCKKVSPPDETSANVEGHWICGGCWNLWSILISQTISETFLAFLESPNA